MSEVLVANSNPDLVENIGKTFRSEGIQVNHHSNGQAALNRINSNSPDLAIIGYRLNSINGLDLLQKVRQTNSIPIIFLSSKSEELDELLALRMGADDFVSVPFSARILLERANSLIRRQKIVQEPDLESRCKESILVRGSLKMDALRHCVMWKGKNIPTTVTEFRILRELARNPGFVKSRNQIMDVAYDDNVYVDDRTIDSHIKRLRRKIRKVDEKFSAIETLYGIGYRFEQGISENC